MSHPVDEHYGFYAEPRTVARKAHACDACGETIPAGATYFRVRWAWEGHIEGCKRCMRCQALHEHLRDLGRGETWPAEQLDCGESYQDHWGKVPDEIQALAFWLPGDPLPQPNRCTTEFPYRDVCHWHGWRWQHGSLCIPPGKGVRSHQQPCSPTDPYSEHS